MYMQILKKKKRSLGSTQRFRCDLKLFNVQMEVVKVILNVWARIAQVFFWSNLNEHSSPIALLLLDKFQVSSALSLMAEEVTVSLDIVRSQNQPTNQKGLVPEPLPGLLAPASQSKTSMYFGFVGFQSYSQIKTMRHEHQDNHVDVIHLISCDLYLS